MKLFVVSCLLVLAVVSQTMPSHDSLFPFYEITANSHYDAGFQIGQLTGQLIKERHAASTQLQRAYIPFYLGNEKGKAIFSMFLKNNTRLFPEFVDEIKGMAVGADVPFEHLFLENLGQEFQYYVPSELKRYLERTEHCSDVAINTGSAIGVCHNEDGSDYDNNHTVMAHFVIYNNGKLVSDFTSYFYAGHLPTAAFGFNKYGFGFTMNYVTPDEPEMGGIGRQFLARGLFDKRDIEEALPWITQDHQSTGHNYQLVEMKTKRVVNVEAGPHGQHHIVEITPTGVRSQFHGNNYIHLGIKQRLSECSVHREKRASEMPEPTSFDDIMNVLGDYAEKDFPIYQSGGISDTLWTLTTACFDLNTGLAKVHVGNPKRHHVWAQFNVKQEN